MPRTETPRAVFMMGLPGSGKSYVAERAYPASVQRIDPDSFKESHPDYDPKNPAALHEWSQVQTERAYAEAMQSPAGDILIDGTGVNAEKMVRRITEAKAAGYTTVLHYVRVPLRVALERNAQRERVVPEHVIRSKALDIATSFEIVAPHADAITTTDNA